MFATRLAVLTALLLSLADAASAQQTVITSKSPFWEVGSRDEALSKACGLGRFNPIRPGTMVARFTGKEGPDVLEVARGKGENLYDPGKRAKANEDYYFRNNGTTDCEVFVGGRAGGGKVGAS